MAQAERYHYAECGLDNIYLLNGFRSVRTPRGDAVNISDIEGLHRAIGLMLVRDKKNLTGREFRFLRHELDLTQQALADLLGVNVQTVARWEKGRTKEPIDGPAQRMIRLMYSEAINRDDAIIGPLRRLAELDQPGHGDFEQVEFEATREGWQPLLVAA
jgi:putative transcriptional regulator